MKKKLNVKLLKNNSGITLIALVITIIVLIILTGISIKIILGDNGLVERAKYAKEQHVIEAIRERLDIVKGSDYIEQMGNNSIDTYFTALDKEKIEPYTVTNKQKITDIMGEIEVDNKYLYTVTIENSNNIKIEYEGKVDEIIERKDKVEITVSGDKEQLNLPIELSASVKINGEDAKSGRYVINTIAEEIGTENDVYTEQILNGNINITLEELNSYYIHTLTTNRYGRKQETVKGPIQITANYHTHIGDSTSGGGCYETPIYHSHVSSCYTSTKCPGTWRIISGPNEVNDYLYRCSSCGASSWSTGGQGTWACDRKVSTLTCKISTSTIEGYNLSCGKEETTVEKYIINY